MIVASAVLLGHLAWLSPLSSAWQPEALRANVAHAQTPTAVKAPPLASAQVDVNGDGRSDTVSIGRSAQVTIVFGGTNASGPLLPFATLSTVGSASVTIAPDGKTLVASIFSEENLSGAGEAMWLGLRGRRVSVLWSGQVGVVDEDSRTQIQVGLIGGKLHRYHVNPAIVRCDSRVARLETEVLVRGKFVSAAPPAEIPQAATQLNALSDADVGLGPDVRGGLFAAVSSSSRLGTMSPDLLGAPTLLADNDPNTSWVEGRPGIGRGEIITFRATDAQPIRYIRIVPGQGPSNDEFKAHNRVRRLGLAFDGGSHFWAELKDLGPGKAQWFRLPAPIRSRCLTLVIDSVYPAKGQRPADSTTAIAEVSVVTEIDLKRGGIEQVMIERVIAGGKPWRAARKLLIERGPLILPAMGTALGDKKLDPLAKLRLRRIAAAVGNLSEPLARQVARGLAQPEAGSADRRELAVALFRAGDNAVAPLTDLIRGVAMEDRGKPAKPARSAAVQVLTRISGPRAHRGALEALSALANKGGQRILRKQLARSLGKRPFVASELDALTTAARTPSKARADFLRAIGVVANHSTNIDGKQRASGELRAALVDASTYEELYRLVDAIGRQADEGSLSGLVSAQKRVEGLPLRPAQKAALRRITVRALVKNRHPLALELTVSATSDSDVGVRVGAVSGLASRGGGGDENLAELLVGDPWPEIRRGAAGALAGRCQNPKAKTHLQAAVLSEKSPRVAVVILSALMRCGGPGLVDFVRTIAASPKRPLRLRAHAIKLLAQVGGTAATAELVALFESSIDDAFSSADAIGLAQAAAGALCQLRDTRAVPSLVKAARGTAFPEIAAASTRALGCFCTDKTDAALGGLTLSTTPGVSVAAQGAIKRCRRRPPK